MARAGHKYPLIVYQHMLNRWWRPMIALGLGMFALAYAEYIEPMAQFLPWRWQLFSGIGGLCILVGIFFLILRHLAYVQPVEQDCSHLDYWVDQLIEEKGYSWFP